MGSSLPSRRTERPVRWLASGGGVWLLISASRSGSCGVPVSKLRLAAPHAPSDSQPIRTDLPARRGPSGASGGRYRRCRGPCGAGLVDGAAGPVRKRQGSRGLLGCPGVATGSPAARQAWKPPITSVALDRPRVCRDAAASDDEYPWSQQMIHLTWWPAASGIRAGLAGSQRHSRWLRSMMMTPGLGTPSHVHCRSRLSRAP